MCYNVRMFRLSTDKGVSRFFFLLSGILLLMSLLILSDENYALWLVAKGTYFTGLLILFFEK
jgi:NADH:ubiquinone oxidoreductase subunit 5 (subunit L)/multisubunit Na+/H+ antiporter MnhA subunit